MALYKSMGHVSKSIYHHTTTCIRITRKISDVYGPVARHIHQFKLLFSSTLSRLNFVSGLFNMLLFRVAVVAVLLVVRNFQFYFPGRFKRVAYFAQIFRMKSLIFLSTALFQIFRVIMPWTRVQVSISFSFGLKLCPNLPVSPLNCDQYVHRTT